MAVCTAQRKLLESLCAELLHGKFYQSPDFNIFNNFSYAAFLTTYSESGSTIHDHACKYSYYVLARVYQVNSDSSNYSLSCFDCIMNMRKPFNTSCQVGIVGFS